LALTAISFSSLFLTLCYVGLLLFLTRGWRRLKTFSPGSRLPKTKVTVLVAARNEEEKIHLTIEDILAQDYPKDLLEIIIVDDHSTDQTSEIISSYSDRGVILLQLNEDQLLNSYKKRAISKAINLSTGDLMVATDADCRMGANWLRTIAAFYEEKNVKLISSPVIYYEEKDAFQEMQTLEFLFLIGLGASSIGNKMPSTCNGANLAYRKDVFLELGGFNGIDDLASGDDELFLHKVASRYPDDVGFCKSSDAMVYTHAKLNLKEFISQRKRWASKTVKYKDKKIVALGVFVWLANVFFCVNTFLGFYDPSYWTIAAFSLGLKIVAEFSFLIPVTLFAKRPRLLLYIPVLSIIHVFYIIYIGLAGNTGKYVWKGRLVR
jgi:cellulose synthase/poly-beta-1,6-N-acetylglucosamine synthase-like glycosyltransferase